VHHASVSRSLAVVLALVLAACGSSDGTPGPTGPVAASVTQGRFSLTFTSASASVHSRDEITGTARLTLLAPGGATFSGPNTILGFEFSEVGGHHRLVSAVFDGVCAPHRITTNTPIDSPIVKGGAAVEGPDADWYRQFLDDPTVKLPAGDWDITAVGSFTDGQGCVGQHLEMRATVRVHVTD
jgi:hypothetical protein